MCTENTFNTNKKMSLKLLPYYFNAKLCMYLDFKVSNNFIFKIHLLNAYKIKNACEKNRNSIKIKNAFFLLLLSVKLFFI